jgi:transcriptional regulator with XRE-family HTH domain
MKKGERTSNAVEILHRRYVKDDIARKAALQEERANAEVARTIYELRKDAGLSQKELAELIGTTQSVISRLEDADYEGHSLSMLHRIAKALNQRLTVLMSTDDREIETVRYMFRELVRGLRRQRGMTVDEFAEALDVERDEVIAMERHPGYRPSPATLHALSELFDIPQQRLMALAGAVREVPADLRDEASRFAAKSESLAKISPEERRLVDEVVKVLRKEPRAETE